MTQNIGNSATGI